MSSGVPMIASVAWAAVKMITFPVTKRPDHLAGASARRVL